MTGIGLDIKPFCTEGLNLVRQVGCDLSSVPTFRQRLKTCLFSISFPDIVLDLLIPQTSLTVMGPELIFIYFNHSKIF